MTGIPRAIPLGFRLSGPDDPVLTNWYHTIDLGHGLVSRGIFDHRPVMHHFGLPSSLARKTCLDVATANGLFAFEMERRGAARVVAMDAPSLGDLDLLPRVRQRMGPRLNEMVGPGQPQFQIAHDYLASKVEPVLCNVYDLSPETVGRFDVVMCGSLLLHLFNPLKALVNILTVTLELAIIEVPVDAELDAKHSTEPLVAVGCRHAERDLLGKRAVYWRFSTSAVEEMLAYAGFSSTRRQATFELPAGIGTSAEAGVRVAVFAAYP
jgi:tRNA (mo5U34)-methyltransferase